MSPNPQTISHFAPSSPQSLLLFSLSPEPHQLSTTTNNLAHVGSTSHIWGPSHLKNGRKHLKGMSDGRSVNSHGSGATEKSERIKTYRHYRDTRTFKTIEREREREREKRKRRKKEKVETERKEWAAKREGEKGSREPREDERRNWGRKREERRNWGKKYGKFQKFFGLLPIHAWLCLSTGALQAFSGRPTPLGILQIVGCPLRHCLARCPAFHTENMFLHLNSMLPPYVPHVHTISVLVAASSIAAKHIGGRGVNARYRSTRNPFTNWRLLKFVLTTFSYPTGEPQLLLGSLTDLFADPYPTSWSHNLMLSLKGYSDQCYLSYQPIHSLRLSNLTGRVKLPNLQSIESKQSALKTHLRSREPSVEPIALIPHVIPRTPLLGQLRLGKPYLGTESSEKREKTFERHERWTLSSTNRVRNLKWDHQTYILASRSQYQPETPSSLCERLILQPHLTFEHKQVTSPVVPTRPPYATLAGEPLLTQPARK
ncbi:hypothetical protein M9H77_04655 [Catharanthus roseus]|uniref:Uncharacterized protein n=1 Tax=Catharanthus roseus TaxID=4058 RepID=A0ACC0CF07_CATRO|nr:hypothetical protein M9H77_04655 [Catharanthus roseus]